MGKDCVSDPLGVQVGWEGAAWGLQAHVLQPAVLAGDHAVAVARQACGPQGNAGILAPTRAGEGQVPELSPPPCCSETCPPWEI